MSHRGLIIKTICEFELIFNARSSLFFSLTKPLQISDSLEDQSTKSSSIRNLVSLGNSFKDGQANKRCRLGTTMKHHHGRPGRTLVRATSSILKWTFIALLFLFLGLQTTPSSTHLAQRGDATLKQHKTTHYLDVGPTSSPLTKAMKVLLHHLPARRSENVVPGYTHRLTQEELDDVQREKELHATSHDLVSPDIESRGGNHLSHGHGSKSSDIETRGNHLSRGHGSRKGANFNPDEESVPASIAYSDHKGTIARRDNQYSCDCLAAHPNWRCSCPKGERSRWKKGVENVAQSHFAPSNPSLNQAYLQSNDGEVKDDTHHNLGEEHRETSRDLIGHDNTGHLCSTMGCFCKSTGRCKRESIRENIALDSMSHFRPSDRSPNLAEHRPKAREIGYSALDERSSQLDSGSEVNKQAGNDIETRDSPHKVCKCGLLQVQCRCPDTGLFETGNEYQGSTTHNPAAPIIREISSSSQSSDYRPHWSRPRPSNWRDRRPSEARGLKDTAHSDIEKGHQSDDFGMLNHARSISCDCKQGSPGCSCGEFLHLDHLQASKERQHAKPCSCDLYSGGRKWMAKGLCKVRNWVRDLSNSRKLSESTEVNQHCSCSPKYTCDIQRPHIVIHEGKQDSAAGQAKGSGTKADENGDFGVAEHIAEENIQRERWLYGLDPKAPHNMHLDPSVADSIATPQRDTTAHITSHYVDTSRICSPDIWCDNIHCPCPKVIRQSKAKSELPADGHANSELKSPSTSAVVGDKSCRKLWRVNTGCLPKQSGRSTAVAVHNHRLPRRSNTLLESIIEAKCRDKVGRDKEECEEKHRTGFWIVCALLGVAGICGLLLGMLVLHINIKRKRPSPLLISNRLGYKSGLSTPATSVSEMQISKVGRPAPVMRRIDEDENDESNSVRRYTTLDGTNDGWTSWIQQHTRGGKVSQA